MKRGILQMENSQKSTLVIAINAIVYGHFLSEKELSFSRQKQYKYVAYNAENIRGYRELDFVCVGINYTQRKDLKVIFDTLEMCNVGTKLEGKTNAYRILYT